MSASTLLSSFALGVALIILPQTAFAQEHPEGEPYALVQHRIANTKNVAGVFEARDTGHAVHVQSGLTCPAYLHNAFLNQLMVYEVPAGLGADVGCDYARRTAPGETSAAAKHTVFAVKLHDGWTLDDAFSYYQSEMRENAPEDARSGGESLTLEGEPGGFPEIRSEELFYNKDGREWQTEVIVTVLNGWIIEVRSTRASQYALVSAEEGIDQLGGSTLLLQAIADLN